MLWSLLALPGSEGFLPASTQSSSFPVRGLLQKLLTLQVPGVGDQRPTCTQEKACGGRGREGRDGVRGFSFCGSLACISAFSLSCTNCPFLVAHISFFSRFPHNPALRPSTSPLCSRGDKRSTKGGRRAGIIRVLGTPAQSSARGFEQPWHPLTFFLMTPFLPL